MKTLLTMSLWAGIAVGVDINNITPPYHVPEAKVCLSINALIVCRNLTTSEINRELLDIISKQDKTDKCKTASKKEKRCIEA